jgi:hypothetical protein
VKDPIHVVEPNEIASFHSGRIGGSAALNAMTRAALAAAGLTGP